MDLLRLDPCIHRCLLGRCLLGDSGADERRGGGIMEQRSKRKPHNWYAGYVCERKVQHRFGGHVVVLDRDKGGDLFFPRIDSAERWICIWEPTPESAEAERFGSRILVCDTKASAISQMKCASLGLDDFSAFVNYDEWEKN